MAFNAEFIRLKHQRLVTYLQLVIGILTAVAASFLFYSNQLFPNKGAQGFSFLFFEVDKYTAFIVTIILIFLASIGFHSWLIKTEDQLLAP